MKKILILGLASVIASNAIYASEEAKKKSMFECTLTDTQVTKDVAGKAKDSFVNTTPKIFLICHSDQVKKGQKIKSTWIAADTNNAAPANYKIDEEITDVPRALAIDEVWTGNFSLSKPNSNWPNGSYHVDIYVDNALANSVKFTIADDQTASNDKASSSIQTEAKAADKPASNEKAADQASANDKADSAS